jgi:hypothetical protein
MSSTIAIVKPYTGAPRPPSPRIRTGKFESCLVRDLSLEELFDARHGLYQRCASALDEGLRRASLSAIEREVFRRRQTAKRKRIAEARERGHE